MRNARYSLVGVSLLVAMAVAASCSKKEESTPGDDEGDGGTVLDIQGGSNGDAGNDDGGRGNEGGNDGSGNTGNVTEPPACDSLKGIDDECGATAVKAQYSTVNMLIVLDKSGSMDKTPNGFELSKWEAVNSAFEQSLPPVAGTVNFGLMMYPYSEDRVIPTECTTGCCEVQTGEAAINVPIGEGSRAVRDVLEVLNDTPPGGGTPTAAALAEAYRYFTSGEGLGLKGRKYVLLATDGAPNCDSGNSCDEDKCTQNIDGNCPETQGNCCLDAGINCLDDENVVDQIRNLADEGISTFVVGIPGTERYEQYLDTFAEEGGVGTNDDGHSYYQVTASEGVQGLVNVFTEITTKLVRDCDIALPQRPTDTALVNVAINCDILPAEGAEDGSAWEINTEDGDSVITITGPKCEEIQQEGVERVDIVTGCPTVVIN